MVFIFVLWIILFKVYNNACIMPRFGRKSYSLILLSVFKTNDAVNFEDNCFVHFSGYQTRSFH